MVYTPIPDIDYEDFCTQIQEKTKTQGIPLSGHLELTFRCNLSCVHCCIVNDPKQNELSFIEITEILDQLVKEGCLWLILTGGEPLVRHDFLDIYSYARKKGFLITVFSNGTQISPEIADYFQHCPPKMIEITLNGITAETFEGITQVPGSFQKCLEGIHLLLDRDLPLTLKTNGMTLNRHEILNIKEFVLGLGKAKFRYDSLLTPKHDGSKKPCRLRLSPEEIIEIEWTDSTMSEQWRDFLLKKNHVPDPESLFPCTTRDGSFCITPYGQLQFCSGLKEPRWNLRQFSFQEGFQKIISEIQSITFQTSSACKTCDIRYLCPQCPARANLETGRLEAPVDYFCDLAQKRKDMRDRFLKETDFKNINTG
ncbi:MAG: radical SAM protein [Candidatus Aminicenantes bacterium]|nr:radical SAM protein [Candidatus Aminicenantes bacterium]